MARGKFYTTEEDERLMAIIEDNPNAKYVEMADRAQRYGICSERSRDALADHISALVSMTKEDVDEEDDNDVANMLTLIYEKKYNEERQKYQIAVNAIIDTATLFENNPNSLKLNLRAIRNWMETYEPERVSMRLETLRMEAKED